MDQVNFLKGAVIGGCIAGLAALFLAPKSGKDLYSDITDGYNTLNKKSHKFADDFSSRAKDFMDSIQGKACETVNDVGDDSSNTFLMGCAMGAVIGAIAGLLLAPQTGDKLRESLGDEYDNICDKAKSVVDGIGKKEQLLEDKFDEWKDVFLTVVNKLSPSSKKGNQGYGIDKILDWATLGLRLYNKVQARR
ncbi:MAG: YtxH domain-containing protein [Parachlamydiaceae bacterium]|nr:YtxH domain-containing protein [Parachlamydiaceae bacterium]